MLIDDVKITVSAGNGGKGAVAFNKIVNVFGPTGGNGGNGGEVIFEGVSDLGALTRFRFQKKIKAESGKNGMPALKDGAFGKTLVIPIPIGTVIHNLSRGNESEIIKVGQRLLIAEGGLGGRGNFFFRSSTNTTPRESQPGLHGQVFDLRLEMKLIADVGLIGLPNSGKSTLLNTLTSAKSKVGNYAFTTLEPSLGDYYGLILADIPGLIEGASRGKGLGDKFLKHIERTNVLFHLIDASSPDPVHDYQIIREELGAYNPRLLDKGEFVFLSKSDEVALPDLEEKLKALTKVAAPVQTLSILDPQSLDAIQVILRKLLAAKKA